MENGSDTGSNGNQPTQHMKAVRKKSLDISCKEK